MTKVQTTPLENTTFTPLVEDVIGRYRIVESLGTGGVGEVFRAEDTKIGRSVALKMLHRQKRASGAGLTRAGAQRLLREARTAAKIHHPNAVVVFDVGEHEGTPYLVMELVVGRTLRSLIGDPTIEVERRIGWLIDIARALAAAHARGIVHQDVKPENVMLREDGVIKVLDFGIARRVVETDAALVGADGSSAIYGTPAYVAPERVQGKTGDTLADQFSWGVLAYELLAGVHPWGVDSPLTQLTERVLTRDAPAPPDALRPEIPKEIGRTILRTLSTRPKDRYASMDEVIDAVIDGWSGAAAWRHAAARIWLHRRPIACTALVATLLGLAIFRPTGPGPDARTPAPPTRNEAAWPDFGSAMSSDAEATSAYRAGMTAMRDASSAAARANLGRAVRLDPSFAAARLRSVLATPSVTDAERADLHKAAQLRASLSVHDRALLAAVEPWAENPPNTREVERRLVALAAARPHDSDYLFQLCRFRILGHNYARATDACRSAREQDPTFAAAFWLEGESLLGLGDSARGSEALAACLRLSKDATACLNDFLQLRTREGACPLALDDTRRLMALDPANYNWQVERGVAEYAVGFPVATVRDTIERAMTMAPAGAQSKELPAMRAKLAVLTGAFDEVGRQLDEWDRGVEASDEESDYTAAFGLRALWQREMGREGTLKERARTFLTSRAAWKPSSALDGSIVAYVAQYRGGVLPRRDFVAARDAWWARDRPDPTRDSRVATNERWIAAFGEALVTRDDAEDALSVLPEPPPDRLRSAAYDEAVGSALLATGHAADAIPHLRRATRMCKAVLDPFHHTWASLLLGQALESSAAPDPVGDQDHAEACRAYRTVLDRWGGAPESRSAEIARERSAALDCR